MAQGNPMGQGSPMGGENPRGGENPIEQNRSAFNPTDLAAMKQQGTIGPDMTVRDLIEGVLKVPLDAPATALADALRKQSQNADPMGKVQNMAGPQQGPPREGPQGPQEPQRGQEPAGGGLDDLMRQTGGR